MLYSRTAIQINRGEYLGIYRSFEGFLNVNLKKWAEPICKCSICTLCNVSFT